MLKHHRAFAILSALLVLAQTPSAQRTVPMNLERIVADGAIIFRGTVLAVSTGTDERTKLITTTVTFAVHENFYGADRPTLTLSLLGGTSGKKRVKLADMPVFSVGEEAILSFFSPGKYDLTSPVGMQQGKFLITTDPSTSRRSIRTTGDHPQLFRGVRHTAALAQSEWAERTVRSVSEEDFSATIRSLVTILKK